MKTQMLKLGVWTLTIAAISVGAGYQWAQHRAAATVPTAPAQAQSTERKPLYWYDPMVPTQHFDKGGKSPFMDMALLPKYAEDEGNAAGVRIDPGIQQNLGIRLAKVERASLAQTIEAVANVQFNERDVAVVQARSSGFVERAYRRAPGDIVPAGTLLADVLVPEWAAAQTEFLALMRSGDKSLEEAAHQRLYLTGMPSNLIAQVEHTRQVHAVSTITTPIAGVLQTLDLRAGMTLNSGMTLAKVNGLQTVWLEAAIPEAQAGHVKVAQPVAIHFTAYPGETFTGQVIAVLPESNKESRTLPIRVELANRHGRLKPGMSAQLRLTDDTTAPALFVPSEAVIRTGARDVVITALPDRRFQAVEVELGREVGGKTEVRRGLTQDQQVVASGQFLIDSEASLTGFVARLGASADSDKTMPQAGAKP